MHYNTRISGHSFVDVIVEIEPLNGDFNPMKLDNWLKQLDMFFGTQVIHWYQQKILVKLNMLHLCFSNETNLVNDN